MIIRIALINDIPDLVALINSAYRGESSRAGWTTEADLLDGVRTDEEDLGSLMMDKHSIFLVGFDETGKNLLGCVHLQKKGKAMYLGMLTVQPQLQAKGIGKQLLGAAEQYAKQQGCVSIEMTVISVRHELITWYNKHGYQSTGVTKPFPASAKAGIAKQPLEFIVLSKLL